MKATPEINSSLFFFNHYCDQAPVVQKAYGAIGFPNTYPLDSDLSDGYIVLYSFWTTGALCQSGYIQNVTM